MMGMRGINLTKLRILLLVLFSVTEFPKTIFVFFPGRLIVLIYWGNLGCTVN